MDARPGLILLSHGSVIPNAFGALERHAEHLRSTRRFRCVETGFINYSRPTFARALSACVEHGAATVIVLPYLLVPGHFAKKIVAKELDRHSRIATNLRIAVAEPIGYDPRLVEAIMGLLGPVSGLDPRTDAAVLIAAHGSPDPNANNDIVRLSKELGESEPFRKVETCYLECNEPEIFEATRRAVTGGAKEVVVVPYFLHSGRHVSKDIPSIVNRAKSAYPKIHIHTTDYLGFAPALSDILLDRALASIEN